MRILQVLAGAEHGGAETAFVDMCIALHDAGHDVAVVTRANKVRVPRLEQAGICVHTLPFGSSIDVYTPFALRRIIKGFKPDIVQSWMSRASQKVTRWSPRMGIPRYLVVSRLGGYYKIKNFKNTDYFVAITPDIKRYLVGECGVEPDRVRQINNFAETESVDVPVRRADYGVPDGATLCLGLGRLHSSKAFDVLIKALAGAQNEPFGTVFVQAWANKVALVTTDSAGPKQFVRHEEDGLITPIDDVEAMRGAILRMVEDSELRDKMIKNGYQRYLQEFTKDVSVRHYIDFYTDIRSR